MRWWEHAFPLFVLLTLVIILLGGCASGGQPGFCVDSFDTYLEGGPSWSKERWRGSHTSSSNGHPPPSSSSSSGFGGADGRQSGGSIIGGVSIHWRRDACRPKPKPRPRVEQAA